MTVAPLDHLNTALSGRYRLEREVGAGGMASVYLADDFRHRRRVAIKVLKPELTEALGAERFLKEIEVTAGLPHTHILPLFDSGEVPAAADRSQPSYLYYVMPFVEGESLRERLGREKQLSLDTALDLTRQVAAALDYAHGRGVVHRDIKPENILIKNSQALLTDFGIALAVSEAGGSRLTQTGLSIGSPQYMSPEQATGERAIDARSDVYSSPASSTKCSPGTRRWGEHCASDRGAEADRLGPEPPSRSRNSQQVPGRRNREGAREGAGGPLSNCRAIHGGDCALRGSSQSVADWPADEGAHRGRRVRCCSDRRHCMDREWRRVHLMAHPRAPIHAGSDPTAGKSHWRFDSELHRRWTHRDSHLGSRSTRGRRCDLTGVGPRPSHKRRSRWIRSPAISRFKPSSRVRCSAEMDNFL